MSFLPCIFGGPKTTPPKKTIYSWNQMTPFFDWKRPCFGGFFSRKIEDIHRFQVLPVTLAPSWVFPKIMVPPNHPLKHRVLEPLFSPSILGGKIHPYFWFNIHLYNPPWFYRSPPGTSTPWPWHHPARSQVKDAFRWMDAHDESMGPKGIFSVGGLPPTQDSIVTNEGLGWGSRA